MVGSRHRQQAGSTNTAPRRFAPWRQGKEVSHVRHDRARRATLQPGKEQELQTLLTDWKASIRPTIPGKFLELVGNVAGQPDQVVFIALAEDQAAFERMSASGAEHAFYGKFDAVFEAKPTWEVVSMEITIDD